MLRQFLEVLICCFLRTTPSPPHSDNKCLFYDSTPVLGLLAERRRQHERRTHLASGFSTLKQQPYLMILGIRSVGRDQPGIFVLQVLLMETTQTVEWWTGWSGGSKMASLSFLEMAGGLDSAGTVDGNPCKWNFYLGGFRVVGWILHGASEIPEAMF